MDSYGISSSLSFLGLGFFINEMTTIVETLPINILKTVLITRYCWRQHVSVLVDLFPGRLDGLGSPSCHHGLHL